MSIVIVETIDTKKRERVDPMTQNATTIQALLRVADIADRMDVSEGAVRKWITKGLKGSKLKATRAGMTGMWRVDPADLEDFLTTNDKGKDD
jgi:hypothetical protein